VVGKSFEIFLSFSPSVIKLMDSYPGRGISLKLVLIVSAWIKRGETRGLAKDPHFHLKHQLWHALFLIPFSPEKVLAPLNVSFLLNFRQIASQM